MVDMREKVPLDLIPSSIFNPFRSRGDTPKVYIRVLHALHEECSQNGIEVPMDETRAKEIIRIEIASAPEFFSMEDDCDNEPDRASVWLNRLVEWGWLRKDYSSRSNAIEIYFTSYADYFIGTFERLLSEDRLKSERTYSYANVYSSLNTFNQTLAKGSLRDRELLETALNNAKSLYGIMYQLMNKMIEQFNSLANMYKPEDIIGNTCTWLESELDAIYSTFTDDQSAIKYEDNIQKLMIAAQEYLLNMDQTNRIVEQCQDEIEELILCLEQVKRIERQLSARATDISSRVRNKLMYALSASGRNASNINQLSTLFSKATEDEQKQILDSIEPFLNITIPPKSIGQGSVIRSISDKGSKKFEPGKTQARKAKSVAVSDAIMPIDPKYSREELNRFAGAHSTEKWQLVVTKDNPLENKEDGTRYLLCVTEMLRDNDVVVVQEREKMRKCTQNDIESTDGSITYTPCKIYKHIDGEENDDE